MDFRVVAVPALFAAIVSLLMLVLIIAYLFRRLQSQERIRALEKGLVQSFDPAEIARRTRRSGVVLIAAALGIGFADALIAVVESSLHILVGLALAVVPLFIGSGLLYDYRLQIRELMQNRHSEGSL